MDTEQNDIDMDNEQNDAAEDRKRKFEDIPDYEPRPAAMRAPATCKILEVKITNGMKVNKDQLLFVFERKLRPIISHLPTIPERLKIRIKRTMEKHASEIAIYPVEDVAVGNNAAKKTTIKGRIGKFKKFNILKDHSGHLFAAMNSPMNQVSKEWENKMREQWRILEKDLPETMFVRVYEPRIDLLRVAMIGPKGTPYHDGLFFFDVFFPSTFPDSYSPPLMRYHSGGLCIHPYVYKCGEVSLSCFKPFRADRNPMWHPGSWDVLQLLVSIQNLVLNKNPYFIRRGFVGLKGSVDGEKLSAMYNENILIKSLKAMIYTMNRPPKNFKNLVVGHFRKRVTSILKACEAYTEGVQVGYFGSEDGNKETCSIKFRNDVAKRIKPLVAAFMRIGAMEAQDFSYLSSKRTPFPLEAPVSTTTPLNPEDFCEWKKCYYTAHKPYEVVEVLVEEGMQVKTGDPFFTFLTLRDEDEIKKVAAIKAELASFNKRCEEFNAQAKKRLEDLKYELRIVPLINRKMHG